MSKAWWLSDKYIANSSQQPASNSFNVSSYLISFQSSDKLSERNRIENHAPIFLQLRKMHLNRFVLAYCVVCSCELLQFNLRSHACGYICIHSPHSVAFGGCISYYCIWMCVRFFFFLYAQHLLNMGLPTILCIYYWLLFLCKMHLQWHKQHMQLVLSSSMI